MGPRKRSVCMLYREFICLLVGVGMLFAAVPAAGTPQSEVEVCTENLRSCYSSCPDQPFDLMLGALNKCGQGCAKTVSECFRKIEGRTCNRSSRARCESNVKECFNEVFVDRDLNSKDRNQAKRDCMYRKSLCVLDAGCSTCVGFYCFALPD